MSWEHPLGRATLRPQFHVVGIPFGEKKKTFYSFLMRYRCTKTNSSSFKPLVVAHHFFEKFLNETSMSINESGDRNIGTTFFFCWNYIFVKACYRHSMYFCEWAYPLFQYICGAHLSCERLSLIRHQVSSSFNHFFQLIFHYRF